MHHSARKRELFSIVPEKNDPFGQDIRSPLIRYVKHLLGIKACETIYQRIADHDDPRRFVQQSLAELDIRTDVDPSDLSKVPRKGACVVVANHPFGALEGLILADLLLSVRTDVKIMANYLLTRIPHLRPLTIPVDPFESIGAARRNVGPLRTAMRWVQQGGLLLVFPAGEVSHYHLLRREVADPPWHPAVARIVRHGKAAVVPIHFKGRNSMAFQLAGRVHPRLRTLLLVREMLKKSGQRIDLKIGNTISYRWLQQYNDDQRLIEYLRWRTYVIGQAGKASRGRAMHGRQATHRDGYEPVAAPQHREICQQEIAALPPSSQLVQSGAFSVWQARAEQIPSVLREIGRLREVAFRSAGEGAGKPLDLDRFDLHYIHLFIWNHETAEVVGAYRLGRTDDILSVLGRKGLYTHTLFYSRMHFFRKIGPALELGRSFIRPEYQKSYSSLLLLWRGIGTYVARHPQYRMLFGPVSISRDYSDLSRRLLATTLLRHSQAGDLALLVRPRNPARLKPIRINGCKQSRHDVQFQDFKEVCSVVSDIELEQKEAPVLLRQYLNLGGQLLSFNIDKLFSNVMDGLVVVDLLQTDRKTLTRYMGPKGVAAFLEYHHSEAAAVNAPKVSPMT